MRREENFKLNFKESSKETFQRDLMLTLSCLYILVGSLHSQYKCVLTHGRDDHDSASMILEIFLECANTDRRYINNFRLKLV